MSERLRRWTRNPLGSARRGSNPLGVAPYELFVPTIYPGDTAAIVHASNPSPGTAKGTWCSGITPAQHAGGPGFNPQRVHVLAAVTSKTCTGLKPRMWQQGGSAWQDASAGNRTRVTSMATMYSTTRPLMLRERYAPIQA